MRRDAVAVEMSHRLRGECLVGGSSRRIDCDGSHFLAGYAGPWNGSGSWLWQGPLKESAGSCGIQARRPLAAVIAVATRRMLFSEAEPPSWRAFRAVMASSHRM